MKLRFGADPNFQDFYRLKTKCGKVTQIQVNQSSHQGAVEFPMPGIFEARRLGEAIL